MGEAVDKVILEFPILYEGWECDYTAWVMERADGARYLKMTNHSTCRSNFWSVHSGRIATINLYIFIRASGGSYPILTRVS